MFALSRPGRVKVQSGYHPALAGATALVNLAALLLFLAVAFSLPRPGGAFGLYLAATLLLLLNAAIFFLRLLATAFGEDKSAAFYEGDSVKSSSDEAGSD